VSCIVSPIKYKLGRRGRTKRNCRGWRIRNGKLYGTEEEDENEARRRAKEAVKRK